MMFLRALLARELRLALRHGGDTAGALLFFFVTGALFPLAIGPAPETLARIAPGIVWVCALLAALLPLDRLFGADHEDGALDQLLLAGPPSLLALGKAVSHWLITGVPLLAAAAPLAIMLRLPAAALPALLGGLAMGSLILSLLGTACAAIGTGRQARRGVAAGAGAAAGRTGADLRRRCRGCRVRRVAGAAASVVAGGDAGGLSATLSCSSRGCLERVRSSLLEERTKELLSVRRASPEQSSLP